MQRVSREYKTAMAKPMRDRAYITVGLGIVNQTAQGDSKMNGDFAYWSNEKSLFNDSNNNNVVDGEYATLEQNFFKADGSMLFMPPNDDLAQFVDVGMSTENPMDSVRVDFGNVYSIKGLTINFGDAYPTRFKVTTDAIEREYTNNVAEFKTIDLFGDTRSIIITPLEMLNGDKRLRIKGMLMGVGLVYTNNDIQTANTTEITPTIADELPSINFTASILDKNNLYNVDSDDSFLGFLETMQNVSISYGITLADGTVEWLNTANLYLDSWNSKKGVFTITAKDLLSTMEDTYKLGNRIYTRTAYDEAISILTDGGLEPDQYYVDEYLRTITLTNPMPEVNHKTALQLLCNATRCILYQNPQGLIQIRANFANIIEPTDVEVTTNDLARWGQTKNVLIGTDYVYADMTKDFFRLDGTQYFLPESDGDYLDSGYVTESVADENGNFEVNPQLTLKLEAGYIYYGVLVDFYGNAPQEVTIHTYYNGNPQESVPFEITENKMVLSHDFQVFDTMTFEFTKGSPYNRIVVNQIAFGNLSDYTLTRTNMTENPYGFYEQKIKDVYVKVFSFTNDEQGEPQEVEDEVYFVRHLNTVGQDRFLRNQLISTPEMAADVSEWIGNYYNNNISYSVNYRGEPRLHGGDIIFMESELLNSLQVEVQKSTLKFNGAFSGSLEMRRALNTIGG